MENINAALASGDQGQASLALDLSQAKKKAKRRVVAVLAGNDDDEDDDFNIDDDNGEEEGKQALGGKPSPTSASSRPIYLTVSLDIISNITRVEEERRI